MEVAFIKRKHLQRDLEETQLPPERTVKAEPEGLTRPGLFRQIKRNHNNNKNNNPGGSLCHVIYVLGDFLQSQRLKWIN